MRTGRGSTANLLDQRLIWRGLVAKAVCGAQAARITELERLVEAARAGSEPRSAPFATVRNRPPPHVHGGGGERGGACVRACVRAYMRVCVHALSSV
jgi:hypothetical protein